MTIKAKDFDKLVRKLGFELRQSADLHAWFEYGGKVVVKTKRSHTKGEDLPFQHSIRQQMKLNEDQLHDALVCKLSREDYIELLRAKSLI